MQLVQHLAGTGFGLFWMASVRPPLQLSDGGVCLSCTHGILLGKAADNMEGCCWQGLMQKGAVKTE